MVRASKQLVQLTIVAVVLAVAGLISLGLPGAVVLEAATRLARVFGAPGLGGDQAWPAALGISLLGPFALIPADLCASKAATSRPVRVLLTIAITLVIDLSCVFGCLLALAYL